MTDSSSIRSFYSESRKYRISLVAGTQFLSQLDRDVVTAVFGNVGTLVCLRCGVVDAQVLQRELGDFTTEDLLDLETGQALVRMGPAASAFNLTIPMRPVPADNYRQEIIDLSRERYYRPASEVEVILRQAYESVANRDSDAPLDDSVPTRPQLALDQREMLECLADNPDMTVTAVYRQCGFGADKGNRIRHQLRENNLIDEVETRLGQGNRPAKFLILTTEGFEAINRSPRSGRGGAVHRHFQDMVARHARSIGYKAITEHRLGSGGSVDVHLSREGITIAVEIGIHSRPQRERKNILKCLDAGYTRVFALYSDPGLLEETRSLFLRHAADEEIDKVVFSEVGNFSEELH